MKPSEQPHLNKHVAARIAAVVAVFSAISSIALAEIVKNPTADRADIYGRWASEGFGSIVEFHACADDVSLLCGQIVWLWKANDNNGGARVDKENPDKKLRSRPLVGVEILSGFRNSAPGVWSDGGLYNPDDGRTYSGSIQFRDDGELELKGCALGLFCKTQRWIRPQKLLDLANEPSNP